MHLLLIKVMIITCIYTDIICRFIGCERRNRLYNMATSRIRGISYRLISTFSNLAENFVIVTRFRWLILHLRRQKLTDGTSGSSRIIHVVGGLFFH